MPARQRLLLVFFFSFFGDPGYGGTMLFLWSVLRNPLPDAWCYSRGSTTLVVVLAYFFFPFLRF